ncbi:hypothetical protein ACFQH6_19880 [Halobacteriaceae archaeon GCM10025711]
MPEPDDEPEYESPFGTTPDWFGAADADADGRPRRDGSFDPAGATWFTDAHPTPDDDTADGGEPAGLLDGVETAADDANTTAAAGAGVVDEPTTPGAATEPEGSAGGHDEPAGADEPPSSEKTTEPGGSVGGSDETGDPGPEADEAPEAGPTDAEAEGRPKRPRPVRRRPGPTKQRRRLPELPTQRAPRQPTSRPPNPPTPKPPGRVTNPGRPRRRRTRHRVERRPTARTANARAGTGR